MKIVFGGIKGGTGKSTLAFHLATYAHLLGKNVVTFDCDFPQFSFTKYYENRKKNKAISIWNEHKAISDLTKTPQMADPDTIYIVDTPGRYSSDITQIHKDADVIISPINDSILDIDTIFQTDQEKWSLPGYFYEIIIENKKVKKDSLWMVVRNRSSHINSKHKQSIERKLAELANKMNCVVTNGLRERTIFRELFTQGQCVLDVTGKNLSISHVAAKMEIKMLWKKITEKFPNL